MDPSLAVYGIGADGWASLNSLAQREILDAEVVLGGSRHLELLPDAPGQTRVPWPLPLRENLPSVLTAYAGRRVAVLASGDPLVSGIGSTLISLLGTEKVRVVPGISSVALARARLGWPAETTEVVTLVGRDPAAIVRSCAPGHRILVLSSDATTPTIVATTLTGAGFGDSNLTIFGDLGAENESRQESTAKDWSGEASALNLIAIACAGPGPALGWTAGLPDEAYESDGQLTRRDVRASALARLAPTPGLVLWDVGAGAGSVGIEWLRVHPTTRAVAIETDPERAARIGRNARSLGVPRLRVVTGSAPGAYAGLPGPDAVFIGGGATAAGVLGGAIAALRAGGRLVVHGVTHQTEALLLEQYAARGGELTRLQVETAASIGSFSGWTPNRAITQWSWTKGPQE